MSEVKVNKISPRTNCGTVTLGDSGDTIALGSGASQTGFGRTGTVDWDTTPKTATFTAVNGDGFFANTTASAFNMNLPAGTAGAIVSVADYAGTWQNNALTVVPNGSDKIGGLNANVALSTEGQSVTFLFVDSTQGWINIQDSTSNERAENFISATGGTVTTCGNCKIHTFTGPGAFCVSSIGAPAVYNEVSYMVVAGGGGGGGEGGGGGAGGFRESKSPVTPYTASPLDGRPSAPNRVTVTATSFPIAVGGGGTAASSDTSEGTNGVNSTFSTITSSGGGFGGTKNAPGPAPDGGPGGSGGGGGRDRTSSGTGNVPPTSPPQGNNGGASTTTSGSAGGGGGGATTVGGVGKALNNPTPGPEVGGTGGSGATTGINGSTTTFAGGGGGGGGAPGSDPMQGAGGPGGGGAAGYNNATAGTANTGGGGGGSGQSPGVGAAAGGSGIVIIRYKFQ